MKPLVVFAALAGAGLGCRAHAPPADVAAAEKIFADAEALEQAGQLKEAAAEFERVGEVEHSSLGRLPARALVRAATIWAEKLSERDKGEHDLWTAIERYPNSVPADSAVRMLVRLGSPQLRSQLLEEARRVDKTDIVDNLYYEAALLIENSDETRARHELEALAQNFPQSPLRDDALWRAAAIARRQKDARGALDDLRAITKDRRQAFLVGSFNSDLLDDALLESGRIYLEDLQDAGGAIRMFQDLRDNFATSNLRDDAQYWIAKSYAAAHQAKEGCEAIARLRREFSGSKYLRKDAPMLAAELGCKP